MSKFDLMWNEEHRVAAAAEGWELGLTVDAGRPISTTYFAIYPVDARFKSRHHAARFVLERAQQKSKLHINALSACSASRMPTGKKK
jgi:hypothetical protein